MPSCDGRRELYSQGEVGKYGVAGKAPRRDPLRRGGHAHGHQGRSIDRQRKPGAAAGCRAGGKFSWEEKIILREKLWLTKNSFLDMAWKFAVACSIDSNRRAPRFPV